MPIPSRFEPKLLYRRLDSLLGSLRPGAAPVPLLDAFLVDFHRTLRDDLGLASGLLYRERGDSLDLVRQVGRADPAPASVEPTDAWALLLLRHRTYLFHDPSHPDAPAAWGVLEPGPAAGLAIGEPPRRHLLLFRFAPGWVPEEVDFVLNTVRAALGSRLMDERVRVTFAEAAEIQKSLLVDEAPDFAGYDIACRSVQAEEVGGDFFDFHPFDGDILGIAVGDASGHGLPAALLVRDVVTGLRMGLERELKMSYVFRKLNRVVHQSQLTSRFVSVFYGELETNGNLIYVNAGHETPLLFLADRVVELRTGGTVIGPLPEARFKRGFAHVDRGATLLLYSDGIPERRGPGDEHFGRERLQELVQANRKRGAEELLELVFSTVHAWGDGAPWEDDATVVVVKRLPAA